MDFQQAIRLDIAKRRVRPKEFFMDFDPLRKGVISDAQFQRAIGAMNLPINQAQLAAISDQYRHGPGQVSYYRFTADMESSFLNEKEASPVKAA